MTVSFPKKIVIFIDHSPNIFCSYYIIWKKYVNGPLQLNTLLGSKRRSRILQERKLGLQKANCQEKKAFYGNTHSLTHPTFIVILFNSIAAVGTKCVISTVLVKVLRFDSATRQ